VTAQGSPDFVAPELRIATLDNDGTLWCEQPFYFQLAFAFDRVKAMAPQPTSIFAFGNSDGDLQMLQWTAAHPGARFMGIVHHIDAEREYA
jgi:hypothetical protein